jgi:hypothetical protein
MLPRTKHLAKITVLTSAMLIFLGNTRTLKCGEQQMQKSSQPTSALKLIISTNKEKYSTHDPVVLNVSITNEGDSRTYIDRRMYWGYGGGLMLEIADKDGKQIPSKMRDDAIMPPPLRNDPVPLVPLDEGHFYGITRILAVNDIFHAPGKYAIRVTYKSWLQPEDLSPVLRKLSVVWAEHSRVESEPVWIEIHP